MSGAYFVGNNKELKATIKNCNKIRGNLSVRVKFDYNVGKDLRRKLKKNTIYLRFDSLRPY